MATINYAFKEISCKIVYYGAGLCGKTTNLQFVHGNVPPKFRGELISLATEQDRTLFFDFLPLDLGEVKGFKTKFQLYTVPGQVYYNATRKLVLRGVDGVVFVVDSQKERLEENIESLKNLKENLKEYGYDLSNIPIVLQYNKRDLPNINSVQELEKLFNTDNVPSFEAVATIGTGVKETLKAISSLVLKKLSSDSQTDQSDKLSASPSFTDRKTEPPMLSDKPKPSSSQTPAYDSKMTQKPVPDYDKEVKKPVFEKQKPGEIPVVQSNGKIPGSEKSENVEISQKISTQPFPRKDKKFSIDTAPTVIQVSLKQECNMYWRTIKIGSGTLEFSNRTNMDNKGDYQITGIFRYLVFKRSYWTHLPSYVEKITKVINGESKEYHHFFLETSEGDYKRRLIDIYLEASKKETVYFEYQGLGGKIRIVPAGKKTINS